MSVWVRVCGNAYVYVGACVVSHVGVAGCFCVCVFVCLRLLARV